MICVFRGPHLHCSIVPLRGVHVICTHETVDISLQTGKVAAAAVLSQTTLLVEEALQHSCHVDHPPACQGAYIYKNPWHGCRSTW